MKTLYRSVALLLVIGLLGVAAAPGFGQAPPGRIPHLAYGESKEFTPEWETVALWLDVTPGDRFTVKFRGGLLGDLFVSVMPGNAIMPRSWIQSEPFSGAVYAADYPGPYLLMFWGEGTMTVTLEQGDTLTVDRCTITFGDTVTGSGSATQSDAYSIDLAADSELTLRFEMEERGITPLFLLPSLNDALQFTHYDGRAMWKVYKIPAELAGTHRIFVWVAQGDYTLTVIEGDAMSLHQGRLLPDTPVSGTGTPGIFDRYTFEVTQTGRVTFVSDREVDLEPRTPKGGYPELVDFGPLQDDYFHTYRLDFPGTYALYVETEGDYTLRMLHGPYMEGLPTLQIGDSLDVGKEAVVDYVLEAPVGTWITLQTRAADGTSINRVNVLDATGNTVYPIAEREDATCGMYQALIHPEGPAPYLLSMYTDSALTFSILEGDKVRKEAGEIALGQVMEGTADDGQVVFYTLPSVGEGQSVAIVTSGPSEVDLFDSSMKRAKTYYYDDQVSSGDDVIHAAYELDGTCPCEFQLRMRLPNYRVEVMPFTSDIFPEPQAIQLGKAVNGDVGDAWRIPYTFEATTDGDLIIELKFDPALTDLANLRIDVLTPAGAFPQVLIRDDDQTETGDGYIVQHYPLYFPVEYTLQIQNLHGPYTLTVDLQ